MPKILRAFREMYNAENSHATRVDNLQQEYPFLGVDETNLTKCGTDHRVSIIPINIYLLMQKKNLVSVYKEVFQVVKQKIQSTKRLVVIGSNITFRLLFTKDVQQHCILID